MSETRVPTGVPGLDEVLHGGFPMGSSFLVAGAAGTGKTVLCLQWLLTGAEAGERCLYVSLVEPRQTVERHVAGFGWSLDPLEFLDLAPGGEVTAHELSEYRVFAAEDVEEVTEWAKIVEAVQRVHPQRVVIDSLTQLRYLATDDYQFRKHLLRLLRVLSLERCTVLLPVEPQHLAEDPFGEVVVDGVAVLSRDISEGRLATLRALEIRKLRGSGFLGGRHALTIGGDGMTVYPHRVESPKTREIAASVLSSGIAGLDALLDGGVETGTATVVTGPSGVGKSSLALQFALSGAVDGLPAAYYGFEEAPQSLILRGRAFGMPVDQAMADGTFTIRHLNPLDLYPDQFLQELRRDVAEDGRRVVVLDSLRGYNLAMEEFGSLIAHMQNLVSFCRGQGVTLFLVNEVEAITGDLKLTELGVSYLVDNALLLRYAEMDGRVLRVVGCLKKRLGGFEPELRELHLGAGGITVGAKLANLEGLLTGVPRRVR